MLEIKNKGKSPVQIIIRSKKAPNTMSMLNIPGIGGGKNVVLVQDELVIKEFVEKIEKTNMISTKYVSNKR